MRLALVVLAGLFSSVAGADGGDRELARQRFEMGKTLYGRGRFAEALVEFDAAKTSLGVPAFDYNIGLCLAKLDRPAEAADALESYVQSKPDDPDAAGIWQMIAELRKTAVKRRAAAPPAPPPAVAPPPAIVAPPPAPTVEPKPAPPIADVDDEETKATRARRTRVATGVAIAGGLVLAVAITTGISALINRSTYDSSCDMGTCTAASYSTAHTLAITTDSLIGVAIVAAATTVVLLVTRPATAVRSAMARGALVTF